MRVTVKQKFYENLFRHGYAGTYGAVDSSVTLAETENNALDKKLLQGRKPSPFGKVLSEAKRKR